MCSNFLSIKDKFHEFSLESAERARSIDKYSLIYSELKVDFLSSPLGEVLFDEWIFLQEYSWVIARIRATFNFFKKYGAVAWVYTSNAFQHMRSYYDPARMGLLSEREQKFLEISEKIKFYGRWVALGFAAFSLPLYPWSFLLPAFIELLPPIGSPRRTLMGTT